jgi:NAD+ synthase
MDASLRWHDNLVKMAKQLNITLAQLNPTVGDLEYNYQKIVSTWKDAKSDLVVFPELFLSGYPPEDLVTKPAYLDAVDSYLKKILDGSRNFKAGAIIPAPYRESGKIFNGAHVIENGKILGSVQKYHLPNYSVFDEMRVFSSAPLPKPIKFRGVTIGLMICEDMWFANIAEHLKKEGADLIIIPNASPFVADKQKIRISHARKRVEETGLPLIYLNQVGGQDEVVYDGDSFVLDAKGNLVHQMPVFKEVVETVSYPFTGTVEQRNDDVLESIYNALVLGLRDYIRKNKFPGILLGLSGGIDSALAAVIAADAIGADKVHGILLPSQYTSDDSNEDALILAKNLGMQADSISIEEPVASFEAILRPFVRNASGITHENIQPRTRGVILMAISNASGKMVLTTGNKSEMAVGYATLYGDMCGGFNVLKDIYKTQVYQLARLRNHDNVIPERTFTKAPTAELRENQTDQDTLPPYDELDGILQGLIEGDKGVDDLIESGHNRKTVLRVWKMLDMAEYKRRQSAPGVKVTSVAFGRDRRYPITNRFVNIIEKP